MDNSAIANQFSLLSKYMTLHEENPFKIRSYTKAARQIEQLPQELSEMTTKAIGEVPGIGAAILKKIETLLETAELPLLESYKAKTPEGIRNMLFIKGIGPKKLTVIWKKMKIESPGELLYACEEDRLTRFKGFGEKTQQKIQKAIHYYLQSLGYYLYADALAFSKEFLSLWEKKFGKDSPCHPTGALRRQCNTLKTLEYVTTKSAEKLLPLLSETFDHITEEEEKLLLEKDSFPQIILYFSTEEQLGSTLFQTTGTEDFLVSFYKKQPTIKEKSFKEELAIFKETETAPIPAYLRESKVEDIPTEKDIIQPTDIKGIIHSHSKWSDGKNSIEEMAIAAKNLGMEYLVISDHSKSAGYANGLSVERILAQQKEIDTLNQSLSPFKIFKSIESDIRSDGSLDYEEEILQTFDLVIASVHSNLEMEKEKATDRILTAINNPYTTILGHPTGRLLLSRKGYPIDYEAIIDACVENKVAIEINAHPRRLDLDWQFIPYAIEKGAFLSINPDAHSTAGLKDTQYGVFSAQKGGLTAERNLSSFSLENFEKYLAKNKNHS